MKYFVITCILLLIFLVGCKQNVVNDIPPNCNSNTTGAKCITITKEQALMSSCLESVTNEYSRLTADRDFVGGDVVIGFDAKKVDDVKRFVDSLNYGFKLSYGGESAVVKVEKGKEFETICKFRLNSDIIKYAEVNGIAYLA